MNKTQEEIDDVEWEELERVERKKREWATIKMCRSVVLDLMGETTSWVEEEPLRKLVGEILDEGWRRLETSRILLMNSSSEATIRRMVEESILERRADEESLLIAFRLAEDKKKRLDRIEVLKIILSNKLQVLENF